jgi:hypothetical protein
LWVWILVGLVGLVALSIASLCAPLVIVIDANTASIRNATVRTRWLFGAYRKQVFPRPKRRHAAGGRAGSRLSTAWTVLRTKELRDSLRKLARRVFPNIKVIELDTRVRLGAANPVMTAILFGAYCAVKPLLRLPSQYHIDVQPSIFAGAFEGTLHCSLKVAPIRLIAPFARFVFSRPGWSLTKMALFGEKTPARSRKSRPKL